MARDAEERDERRGPTLHAYALGWLKRYSGSGRDSLRDNTRRECRRLLETFAPPNHVSVDPARISLSLRTSASPTTLSPESVTTWSSSAQ